MDFMKKRALEGQGFHLVVRLLKSNTYMDDGGWTHVIARWEDPVPATARAIRGWEWSASSF